MSNPIRKLVKDIQYKTDFTLDQIAEKLGYSPAYFRNEVSKGKSKSVLESIQTKFNDIIEQNVSREIELKDPQTQYKANGGPIPDYRDEVIKLLKEQNETLKMRVNSDLVKLKENQALIEAWVHTNAKFLARLVAKQEKRTAEEVLVDMGKNGASIFENILRKDKAVRDGSS